VIQCLKRFEYKQLWTENNIIDKKAVKLSKTRLSKEINSLPRTVTDNNSLGTFKHV